MLKKIYPKNLYDWYLWILGIIVSLPVLAPIFLALGFSSIGKFLYFLYSFTCHQFHTRSLYLLDYQYAWCARDSGIWFGFFVVALLLHKKIISPIKYRYLILFLIPLVLDGGIQTINTLLNFPIPGEAIVGYYSNNFVRFMTGALFGTGLSFFFSTQISAITQKQLEDSENTILPKAQNSKPNAFSPKQSFILLILIYLVTYFALIQLWNITSANNKPTNVLDSVVKVEPGEFFLRRKDGICPVNANEDFFDWGCFLGREVVVE